MAYYAVTGTTEVTVPWLETVLTAYGSLPPNVEGVAFGGAYGMDTFALKVLWSLNLFAPTPQRMLLYPEGKPYNADCHLWCTVEREIPGGYMKRNDALVEYGKDGLIAFPKTPIEELRSGTWATIRRARKAGVPVYIFPLTEAT